MPKARLWALVLAIAAAPLWAEEPANPLEPSPTWDALRYDVVGDAAIADGAAIFAVEAPYRAHDAATVPVRIVQTAPDATLHKATVVIDENPAPVAADLTFGPALAPLDFELRVRVNQYSNLRVIADTGAGLAMTGRFVKASGGCSAPATKGMTEALAAMGQMRLKTFASDGPQSGTRREAQIMIRHPNYSGLQRDQITQLFIAPHFIDRLEVRQGDEVLFTMEGGISISENPVFRFQYTDNGAPSFRVLAHDTEGMSFAQDLPKEPAS